MRFLLFFIVFILFLAACNRPQAPKEVHVRDGYAKTLVNKAKAFDHRDQVDSAYYYYYKLLQYDMENNDSIGMVKTNVNLMALEYKMNDFPACEKRCEFVADYSKRNKRFSSLFDAYNILGLSAFSQKKYHVALENFNLLKESYRKAPKEVDTVINFLQYHENVGNVYAAMKNYAKSNALYQTILNVEEVKEKGPEDYARTLDNIAKNTLDAGFPDKAFPLLSEALKVRQENQIPSSLIMSYMHFAEYYLLKNDLKTATQWANKSLQTCNEIHNIHDALTTLQILSKSDAANAPKYFNRYVALKDSILMVERNFKDNTARIRMKTREKEEQLLIEKSENHSKDVYLFLGSLALFSAIAGVSILMRQKRKINKQNSKLKNQNVQIINLQREVHHRVKNDLDNVMRALNRIPNQTLDFKSLKNKVFSIKLVHDLLVDQPQEENIALEVFIEKLMRFQNETYFDDQRRITLELNITGMLHYKRAQTLGLLLNELSTNSYKYAFSGMEQGVIGVSTQVKENEMHLIYFDTGIGIHLQIDFEQVNTRGMNLVNSFAKKLDGILKHIPSKKGFQIELSFPLNV